MLKPGDRFDGYEIRAHIARGGMSDIYRAFEPAARRDVVLKIPDSSGWGDPVQFERFQRELEITQTLDHPTIQRGLGSGTFERAPYLVAEYVEGRSLRELIDSEAPLHPQRAQELVRKIADGIAYCHEHGVIHRDLKPENILVTAAGQPVILDFGLAFTRKGRRITYPKLSSIAGTPEYMAPEQVDGQRGDPRTDLYAIGIIFHEMLAGHPPFEGDSPAAVMGQHVFRPIPRLDRERPAVSEFLTAVIVRCLQKKPADRFVDIRAFLHALDHPETVDLAILETAGGKMPADPYLRNQLLVALAVSIGILLLLALAGLVLQWVRFGK
ncbi:MAG: serine/threonine protein kinase [Anaerolineales bacterium]|nr:serine/threonine protein kinase [Anaerolineales bacterium]